MTSLDTKIFREYDIRGEYPKQLNEKAAYLIGQALGSEIIAREKDPVCYVAWDGRHSSPSLKEALIQGLNLAGCSCKIIGATPTPVAFWAASNNGNCAIITGSHNPKQDNGVKLSIGGSPLSGHEIQNLLHRITHQTLRTTSNQVINSHDHSVELAYQKKSLEGLTLDSPIHVVLDGGNGIGGPLAKTLLEKLGCQVYCVACTVDGDFPLHHPDPSKIENLRHLQDAVIAHRANIGIALDGDADRIGVVDEMGQPILADRLSLLFIKDILKKQAKQTILWDVKCTSLIHKKTEQWGGHSTMIATGHSTMKKEVKRLNAAFAAELSGHLLFNDNLGLGVDDGIYAALRLVVLLSSMPLSMSQLMNEFPILPATAEIQIPINDSDKHKVVERLYEQAFKGNDVDLTDGMRIQYKNGWALIRASNTTPCLTLRFEADDVAELNNIRYQIKQVFDKHLPGLTIMF